MFNKVHNIYWLVRIYISKIMKLITVITLLLFCTSIVSQPSFTVASSATSPNTARSSSSQYTIQLNAITTSSSNFDLSVSFTSAFSLSAVTGCQLLINSVNVPSAICQLNIGSNLVTFSQLNNAQVITSLNLVFSTSTALYAGSFVLTLSYYAVGDSSNIYSTNSAPITIINAAMTCSVSSSATRVGATTNYTLIYTPSVFISAGSILQVLYPPWSSYTLTNFPSFTSSAVCAGQCSLRTPNLAQSLNNELVTYTNLYSASSSSSMTLSLKQARNPASMQPITISFTLLYYISSTSQPAYMSCSTTYAPTSPNSFNAITFTSSSFNNNIGASNTINLLLTLNNPVSSTTHLQIVYPSDMALSYTYVTSNQLTTQATFTSGVASSLLIGTLTSSTSQFNSLFLASFTLVNAPYANYPLTISFTTMNLVSSTYHSVDTGSVSYTFTTGSITSASISVDDSSINTPTKYTLTFTITNPLISNSLILITMPIEVTLSSTSTCSCTVASNCVKNSPTSILITINTLVVAGGSVFKVTINSVTNPATTTASSTFAIGTYYYNMSTPTDVLTSPLTVTSTSVLLASASVSSSSAIVAATGTYTITIQIRNALPATSYLSVSFPSTSFVNSASASLSSFTSAGNTIAACTMSLVSQMSFNFMSCVPSSLAQSTTIIITLANIINPYSTKPTDSLSISTYYNSKQMEYISSGVSLTLTTPTSFTFIGVVPVSTIVNAVTTYTFTINFQQQHSNGDRIIITFPSSVTINSGFTCSTNTVAVTVACLQTGQIITLTLATSSTIPSGLVISVTNIQNNWYTQTISVQVQTTTSDTTYYYVQQGIASTVLQAATLAISYSGSNNLVLLSPSTLQLTITCPFSVSTPNPSLLKVVVTPPNDFTITTPSCTSSLASSICTNNPTNLVITSLTTFTNTLIVGFNANANYFTTSSPFSIVLSYNGANVATNVVFTVSSYCTNPCQGCTSTATQCTSCLPTPYSTLNYLFPLTSTCVASCPATYYLPVSTVICQACNSINCLNCATTATTCTSCNPPKFLLNSACVLSCTNGYYGSNNVCMPCVNQCLYCSSISFCLSCVTSYSLNIDNTCLPSCPAGYASINSICTICTNNCLTCLGTVSSCLSCSPTYVLYNNTCTLGCPLGQFKNTNSLCQACVSPCSYCISALVCTSCISNYSLYNGSQCVNPCPAGTFIYTSNCQSCSSTCQTCFNTASNCTSCSSSQYLYINNCYDTCPLPTYAYQGNCTTCVSPCSSCLSNAFSCASCISGYYLLNITCIQSCPAVGYVTQKSSCVACPINCLSCSSPTTCTICVAQYLQYQGSCLTSCPTTSPIIINQTCTGCASQCATCGAAPDQCLTCTVYYYKYSYTCVQSCPLAYYSNEMTYTCDSGLSSKIVFFPVLISYIVVIVLLVIIKIFSKQTSFPTALAALSGWLEIAICAFLLSLLFQLYLEPGVNYTIPKALLLIALLTNIIGNILHFKLNFVRLQQDEYIRKWQDINLNNSFLKAIRIISLLTHHRFFRLIYSKLFHSIHFSMVALKPQNIFTYSTVSTIYSLLLSELLVVVASFYLAYSKLLKDQIFYTSCESLIVTLISIFISLIDIYKPKDYFQDTEFMETKRFLQQINNNASLNKVEDEYRDKDEGSMDGERCVGSSGGKFIFSKHDPTSMNEILFQENSAATDIHRHKVQQISQKGLGVQGVQGLQESEIQDHDEFPPQLSKTKSNKKHNPSSSLKQKSNQKPNQKSSKLKINIFEPIQEDEAEYYQILKYDEEDFKTAVKIQKQKIDGNQSEDQNQEQIDRKQQFRPVSEQIDDRKSMMEYRERREQWNNLIDHRQKLAHQIFNTIDTKELYKQLEKIEEPQNEDEDKDEDLIFHTRKQNRMKDEEEDGQLEFIGQERERKRNRRRRKYKVGNKELQAIYLQRLAEKVQDPKRKTMMASSKSFKYQF